MSLPVEPMAQYPQPSPYRTSVMQRMRRVRTAECAQPSDMTVAKVDDQSVAITRRRQAREVDGNHVLYHFLQKGLLHEDVWLFQMLTARLVVSLGIWFPLRTYSTMPLLTPHAVRDNSCRKDVKAGRPEAWGSPNSEGYFRDDNSLIKNIPSALPIESRFSEYDGARMGNGFVASHVWRKLTDGGSASQRPLTNSFIPNLVWLPSQVAKLSDREGSFVQTYLQAISAKIYRSAPVSTNQQSTVAKAWDLLPDPSGIPLQGLPRVEDLNFFAHSDGFLKNRLKSIRRVQELIACAVCGQPGPRISKRYNEGLQLMRPEQLEPLNQFLRMYLAGLEDDCGTE
jgi:hypothetical protein